MGEVRWSLKFDADAISNCVDWVCLPFEEVEIEAGESNLELAEPERCLIENGFPKSSSLRFP